jgi:ribosomal protein S12 methylthiotransferase
LDQSIRDERQARFMAKAEAISVNRLKNRVGQRVPILVDHTSEAGGIGRTAGDAPEIDGIVRILPVSKPSKRYRVGDFVRGTIVDTQGHDLIAQL